MMGILKKSIAAKLTLQSCILVIVLIISLGSISFYMSSKAIEQEVESKLEARLDAVIAHLNGEMNVISGKLLMIADMPRAGQIGTDPVAMEEMSSIMEAAVNGNKEFLETMFITDGAGNVIADGTGGSALGTNIAEREYYKQAMNGNSVWSDIIVSKLSGEKVRVFAHPVKDLGGKTTGILASVVKFTPIETDILEVKVGDKGYSYLIDKNGVLLVHPKADLVGKNVKDLNIPELITALPDMVSGKSGKTVYTYDGVRKLNVYSGFDTFSVSINANRQEYLASVDAMGRNIILLGVCFMVLGGVVSYLIALQISRKIRSMQNVLRTAEEGDLTVRVSSKDQKEGDEIDQMGLSVNHTMEVFGNVISEILKSSEIMSSTSQEMAASSEEGGRAAGEVTSSIQQITAGLNEQSEYLFKTAQAVTEMQRQIDKSADETTAMAKEIQKVVMTAEDGQRHMADTMMQMKEIESSSQRTFEVIKELNSQSELIGQISEAISRIADQTNLLALNAAIEAARAGEQGRGFAVVADEIRKLASESMSSAENIGKLIQSIQSEISFAQGAITTESQSIEKGVAVINTTQLAFEQIIDAVNMTAGHAEGVLSNIEVAKDRTYEVNQSIQFISGVAQESTASAEEVTANTEEQNAIAEEIAGAADHLSNLAMSLLSQVSMFKVSK